MQKHIENAKPTRAKERDLVSGGVMSDKIALPMSMSDQPKHSGVIQTLPAVHSLERESIQRGLEDCIV